MSFEKITNVFLVPIEFPNKVSVFISPAPPIIDIDPVGMWRQHRIKTVVLLYSGNKTDCPDKEALKKRLTEKEFNIISPEIPDNCLPDITVVCKLIEDIQNEIAGLKNVVLVSSARSCERVALVIACLAGVTFRKDPHEAFQFAQTHTQLFSINNNLFLLIETYLQSKGIEITEPISDGSWIDRAIIAASSSSSSQLPPHPSPAPNEDLLRTQSLTPPPRRLNEDIARTQSLSPSPVTPRRSLSSSSESLVRSSSLDVPCHMM